MALVNWQETVHKAAQMLPAVLDSPLAQQLRRHPAYQRSVAAHAVHLGKPAALRYPQIQVADPMLLVTTSLAAMISSQQPGASSSPLKGAQEQLLQFSTHALSHELHGTC
jgi:hypothetical protein